MALVNAGYAVVLQDTRGTYASEGELEPKINEIADGQDKVAWIIRQVWSDGTIGMYGASYSGMSQWDVAITDTPGLEAITPAMAATDWNSELWYCTRAVGKQCFGDPGRDPHSQGTASASAA